MGLMSADLPKTSLLTGLAIVNQSVIEERILVFGIDEKDILYVHDGRDELEKPEVDVIVDALLNNPKTKMPPGAAIKAVEQYSERLRVTVTLSPVAHPINVTQTEYEYSILGAIAIVIVRALEKYGNTDV